MSLPSTIATTLPPRGMSELSPSDFAVSHERRQRAPVLSVAPEPVDPMGEAAWRALQPSSQAATEIQASINRVNQALAEAGHRITYLESERTRALLHGTSVSLALIDAKLHKASTWLERVAALAGALPAELDAAKAREARAAEEKADRITAARPKIARFAEWVRKDYGRHARAIAAGLELEREAIEAARAAGIIGEVPLAFTGEGHPKGMPPTSFARMVRLPNAEPGLPIHWPPGEQHPDFRPNTIRCG